MQTISDIQTLQQRCLDARAQSQSIAFVPTMGFLHQGHLSLLQEGRKKADLLVLSIFVNPTQFAEGEDLDAYPRDFERDEALAREAGVDLIFYPTAEMMYPDGYASYVSLEGPLTNTLEGASRPTHFRGVTTVVCKLFNIVQPHLSFFGRKDFQQLAVISRMTEDLNLPVQVIGMPIVRESDGLAMSSRNVYLSDSERQQALSLVDSIRRATAMVKQGCADAAKVVDMVRQRLQQESDLSIDYVKLCHGPSLEERAEIDAESVLLLAVRVGKTRLIDNHLLAEDLD
ncbi:MAG: pantoate--beta-alanine ligase [Desulfuromonadales bacterium]|nr:pantoate--beta-alanine ligase [Desulfuromonadales bacterium]